MNFVVLLASLVMTSLAADLKEKRDGVVHCSNPLPGLRKLKLGIDLRNFELLTNGAGRTYPLLDFTCSNGRTRMYLGKSYEIPDQVVHQASLHSGWSDASATVIKTTSDITKSYSIGVTVKGSYGPVAATASTQYSSMKRTIENGENFITRTEGKEETMSVTLASPDVLQMRTELTKDIAKLPSQLSCLDFIHKYGTHYVSAAKLGGTIVRESIVKTKYLETQSEQDLKVAASIAYKSATASASVEMTFSKSDKEKATQFNKNSESKNYYHGGDVNFAKKDKIADWQETVRENPALVDVTLTPIYKLIKDKSVQDQMKAAVGEYMKVHGRWTPWTPWSCATSSKFSSTGTAKRTRSCTDPPPANGGEDCTGATEETAAACKRECTHNWWMYDGECFGYFTGKQNFQEAVNTCQRNGAVVSGIRNLQENDLLRSFGDYMWIGATDKAEEGTWKWTDTGMELSHGWTNWQSSSGEPNGGKNENCVKLWDNGQWKDYSCNKRETFMCRKPPTFTIMESVPPLLNPDGRLGTTWATFSCKHDWSNEYNGECYRLFTNAKNFYDAQGECAYHGASLARAYSYDQTQFLLRMRRGKKIWIGASDEANTHHWRWMDNHAPVNWSYWKSGEPNNGRGGTEHCAQIRSGDGRWNDVPCRKFRDPFICVKHKFNWAEESYYQ